MLKPIRLVALTAVTLCTGVPAADMLPLKQGIYLPKKLSCQAGPNAETVNYWGGRSSFSSAQATCTISNLTRDGNVFTITENCIDIRGGGEVVGGQTVVTIARPTSFTRAGVAYRYCGTKVHF